MATNDLHNPIPEYSERLWGQPNRHDILVTDETATMPRLAFDVLREYSHSTPTAVADGKMWKLRFECYRTMEVTWYLRWYAITNKQVTIHSRKIVIADWKQLLGS
ncbi:hypothetical protein HYP93_gp29 [Stenotrophomonas phage Pokken]|uniref:Uncharacterized protein n=1 Tax=Stenotrophomonas phage Pokken TaxID=2596674 RepID=A0A5B9N9T9_9CAUD|nr:hypothetical protein HYP93_gp29 [Stenotrophomonas phage Pokken]QEG09252.1 hypothetical protein CPT_Pokken_029 [Stenotrophomonas phage Pokken]